MIETATGLWQKGVECQKRKLIEKSLGESSASYKKVKIDCLASNGGSKNEEEIQRQQHYYNNLTAVVMR